MVAKTEEPIKLPWYRYGETLTFKKNKEIKMKSFSENILKEIIHEFMQVLLA